jgi:hypothetical protein
MMQHSAPWLILAASQDMHRVWGRFDHARPGTGDSHYWILLAAVALLAVVTVAWQRVGRRTSKGFCCDSDAKLFRELCAAHRLERSVRRLLKRLAAARQMSNPALLFVQPECFETTTLPALLTPSTKELQKLREQLFE